MGDGMGRGAVFREQFASTDLVGFEEFLCANYADVALRHTGGRERFGHRHEVIGAEGFTVSRMQTSFAYGARLAGMHGLLMVASVRAGGFSSTSDRHGELSAAAGDTALTPPTGEVSWVSDPVDVDLIAIDGAEAATYAAGTCGIPAQDLRITGLSPISPSLDRYWNATVAHVRDDILGNPVAASSAILVDTAFQLLAAALLTTFPNTALAATTDPDVRPPRGDVSPARLREVADYLHTHAHRPVGTAEIAAVADAPVREVIRGLWRHQDTSPAKLLWQARLHGAHRELRDTDPTAGTTVAAVAASWGFDHPGRFRIAYVEAFDEQPEDTLDR